ncbi:ATP-binding protein [Micromonospora cremea]|uniref:Histidine kinase-like ATPase domain-containing protein n=1 Tax=Micromonospora cremea TaxID=709881 RepID=A0A1N5ZAK4_9ACTN|nr:ATP-binding protein [Micromonospora cremea]SIN18783.1 Histidine kinase-like ATPase domain-containing protein [Micromonospora cremea]
MTFIGRPDATFVTREHNGAIMPTDVRCLVEIDESSGVVRLTGVLDAAGADTVRAALLAVLCDRPGPVVADVSGLRVADQVGQGVFAEIRREVADWPAADVLLCDPSVSASGGADAALAGVPAWPTLDGALAAAPLAAVLTAELAPTVGAARQARELVTTGCQHWDVRTLAEPASIAITEMVNNVVAHARTPMTIRLAPQAGTLRVAVRDHSPLRPAFAGVAPPTRAGGRGLLLIDMVARRWGSSPVPDGKVVWCVLHPEDESAPLV